MGALLRDDLYMGAFSLRIIIHVIDVLTSARLRLAAELSCQFLTSEMVSLFRVYSHAIVLFCLDASQSIGQYST